MSTDSKTRWVIKEVTSGDVTVHDPGEGYRCSFRAVSHARATVMNSRGGQSEIRFDAYVDFEGAENIGDAVIVVVKGGIEGARRAAQAYCEAANAPLDAEVAA